MLGFTGTYKGEVKNIPYKELVGNVLEPGEEYTGVGSAPTSALVRNKNTQEMYEVDLKEAMRNSGFEGIKFQFDAKEASKNGMLTYGGVDNKDSYNLARLKNSDLQQQYLDNKGYASTFNDGEDWYGVKDGYIHSITNTSELGKVDALKSWGAKQLAGAGSMVGAIAVTTLTGVGAAATGGAALAVAGAASGVGAVIGETAQRGIDYLVSPEVAELNSTLSAGEEAKNVGIEAAGGAVGGVLGQYMGKGIAKATVSAYGAGAKATTGAAEEWFTKQQTKAHLSYLEQQLPSGFMQKFASSEEASANDLLKTGAFKQASKKEQIADLQNTMGKKVDDSLQDSLAPGSTKQVLRSGDEAQEAAFQKQARESYKKQQETIRQKQQVVEENKMNSSKLSEEKITEYSGHFDDLSRSSFKDNAKHVDNILGENVSKADADKAYNTLLKEHTDGLQTDGLKIAKDDKGKITGFDPASMDTFLSNKTQKIYKDTAKYVEEARGEFKYSQRPDSSVQGTTIDALNKISGTTKNDELKAQLFNVKEAIRNHNSDNQESTKTIFDNFHKFINNNASKLDQSSMDAVISAQNATMLYESKAASNAGAFSQYMHTQSNMTEIVGLEKSGLFKNNKDYHVDLLSELEHMSGNSGSITKEISQVFHLNDVLHGKYDSPFRKNVSAFAKDKNDALAYLSIKKDTKKEVESTSSGVVAGVTAFGVAKASGAGYIESLLIGREVASGARNQAVSGVLKKAIGATEVAKPIVKAVTNAGGKAASFVAPKALGQKIAFSSEEYISKKRLEEHKETQAEFKRKQKEKAERGER